MEPATSHPIHPPAAAPALALPFPFPPPPLQPNACVRARMILFYDVCFGKEPSWGRNVVGRREVAKVRKQLAQLSLRKESRLRRSSFAVGCGGNVKVSPQAAAAAIRNSRPARHVKTLAERGARSELSILRDRSRLTSGACGRQYATNVIAATTRRGAGGGEDRGGGLVPRVAAAAAFPDRNCFSAQIHRR